MTEAPVSSRDDVARGIGGDRLDLGQRARTRRFERRLGRGGLLRQVGIGRGDPLGGIGIRPGLRLGSLRGTHRRAPR